MSGLLRGVARTAIISGTASAVSGRVQRRQAARFAQQDAQTAAMRQEAYREHVAPDSQSPGVPMSTDTMLEQLKVLGDLKAQGILTEAEFASQKAKILGS